MEENQLATDRIIEPTELTIEEILMVFGNHPLHSIAICEPGCEPVSDVIEGVDFVNKKVIAERTTYDPKHIKLILKRIDKITDDVLLEIAINFLGEQHKSKIFPFQGKELIKSLFVDNIEFSPNEYIHLIEILKNKEIETKPPFGKNHWAKDKTYFDLGLAIEAGPAKIS